LFQAEIAKLTMPTQLQNEIILEIAGVEVVLRSDATIRLPEFKSLLVADLHLGKDASFRAAGLPVPEGPNQTTFDLLSQAIAATRPEILLLLGDLIHNRDAMTPGLIEQFARWRTNHSNMRCVLVRGNHDRHVKTFPATWQMEEVFEYRLGPFELVHEVAAAFSTSLETSGARESQQDNFQIGGHWHPVIHVGRGADRMRLRCFVVGRGHITLPAFGPFKGGLAQRRNPSTTYYPTCDGKIWRL
jgi:DNA ligase-associated metallophosphoesterase